eukprot:6466173-Amphidinium_carterae.1
MGSSLSGVQLYPVATVSIASLVLCTSCAVLGDEGRPTANEDAVAKPVQNDCQCRTNHTTTEMNQTSVLRMAFWGRFHDASKVGTEKLTLSSTCEADGSHHVLWNGWISCLCA